MHGFLKNAVPTWNILAPAIITSNASSNDAMPPQPIIGMDTAFLVCQTMRTAIGNMHGPDNPPTLFLSIGLLVFMSIFMPSNVFINVKASAPPSCAAFAISVIDVTFGDSFTINGFVVFWRTKYTSSSTVLALLPNAIPPFLTFGQDIFNSIAHTLV